MKKLNRFRVITHKQIQIRLASVFLFWFLLAGLFFTLVFVIRFSNVVQATEGMRIHDEMATKVLLVDQARDLALWYGAGFFAFGILIWLYMMAYAHRLTGPIYKLERMLEKANKSGELPPDLGFRTSDAFQELPPLFNKFKQKFCSSPERNKKDV